MRAFRAIAFVVAVGEWSLFAYMGPTSISEARSLLEAHGLQRIQMSGLPIETDAPGCTGRWRQGFLAAKAKPPLTGTNVPMNVAGNVCCDDFRRCEVVIDAVKSMFIKQPPYDPEFDRFPGAFKHSFEDYFGPTYMPLGKYSNREECEKSCVQPNICHRSLFVRDVSCLMACQSDDECPPATRCSCTDPERCAGGDARLIRKGEPFACAWAHGLVPYDQDMSR